MHGVPMLKWNNNLAKHSMDWGIEAGAQMKHSTQDARSGKTLKKEYKMDKVIKKFSYAGENLCWGSPRPQGPCQVHQGLVRRNQVRPRQRPRTHDGPHDA
jgi:uncharacterized protein YkwD